MEIIWNSDPAKNLAMARMVLVDFMCGRMPRYMSPETEGKGTEAAKITSDVEVG
jgi:hypothetical protein